MLAEIFKTLSDWYMSPINYGTITLLMTIESSFVPLPSEIVIPPAIWKALDGSMNVYLVVIFGTLGAVIGACVNYFLSLFIGRIIVYRLADTKVARLMFINSAKVQKAEDYFLKNGNSSTFIGRLIPGIRHLISIPAGLSKMNIKKFVIYTFLGAFIWNITLSILSFFAYTQRELLKQYMKEISLALVGLGILFVIYLIIQNWRKRTK
jgi:membrane protein DedA with SNARE-associated domain